MIGNPIGGRGAISPAVSSTPSEVTDWVTRVQGLGSDVSTPTQTAVSTFVNGLKTDGVWTKIQRLNIYAGNDITASKAPLVNLIGSVTESLNNFVASDYTQSVGLKGNTTTKAILTGVNPSASFAANTASIHFSCYVRNAVDTNNLNTANIEGQQAGSGVVGLSISRRASQFSTTYWDCYDTNTSRVSISDANGRGLYVGSRTNPSSSILYKSGSVLSSSTGSIGLCPNVVNTAVHAFYDSAQETLGWSPNTLEMYSMGTGLTATDVGNFNLRYNTLRNSLDRQLTGSSDPDVADWIQRVVDQGSAVTSGSTVSAVETFVAGLKSDGVWDKIKRLNIYAGDTLNALKAPLKIDVGDTADTLTNFVASDYTSSVGLKGGATKYIQTGAQMSDTCMGDNDIHLSCYVRVSNNDAAPTMGAQDHTASDVVLYVSFGGTTYFDSNQFTTGRIAVADSAGVGHYIGSRSGSAAQGLYKAGSLIGSNTGTAGTRCAVPLMVFCLNDLFTPYVPTTRTMEMYSIGNGLSAADVTNYTNRYNTLRSSLGR